MTDKMPEEWAVKAACERLNAEYSARGLMEVWGGKHHHKYHPATLAFARYIEQHEEPPVDPLEEALRAEFPDFDLDMEAMGRLRRRMKSMGITLTTEANNEQS